VLIYQPHTEGAAEIEANLNAFMAPHLASLKVPANVTFSVLPKPLQMVLGTYGFNFIRTRTG